MKRTLLILYFALTPGAIFSGIYWFTMNNACVNYQELLKYTAEGPVKDSVCVNDGVNNAGVMTFLLIAAMAYTAVSLFVLKILGYSLQKKNNKGRS